ncbi:MAG: ABC transporter ATP-binding protein [Myxococcota bacterium]
MAEPAPLPGPDPVPALSETLQRLLAATELPAAAEAIEQAVRAAPRDGGLRALQTAAADLGLQVRWLVARPGEALPLARPDLPLAVRGDDGAWWVVDGAACWFRAAPAADPRGRRWRTGARLAEALGGDAARAWALAEPVLPAAALGGARSPVRRLRTLLWAERRDLGAVVVYGAVAGLMSLATPLAVQVLINWLAFGALLQPVVVLGAVLLGCLALAAALRILQRLAVEALERRLFVRTVADLSTRLSRVQRSALDDASGPELANRFFDVLTLQKAAGTLLLDGTTAVLQVLVAVALLAAYHPALLAFDVLLVGGMALALAVGRGAARTAVGESAAKYDVAAWIEEISRHPGALRLDGGQLATARADVLARTWLLRRRDHFRVFLRQLVAAHALVVAANVALLVACGALVLRGQLTVGQLVAAEFIVNAALVGFAKFADKLDTVYDLLAGVDKLGHLVDLPVEPPTGRAGAGAGPAELALQGVPSLGDRVLAPGSRTTVLGPPGAGKSRLAEVLVGLRAPGAGTVRRDGVDLRQLRPDARYQGVVLVRTRDVLRGTVRDNVGLGRTGVTPEAAWAALDAVGLREQVEALPGGLDAPVDPGGGPLTELERRALLVARAVSVSADRGGRARRAARPRPRALAPGADRDLDPGGAHRRSRAVDPARHRPPRSPPDAPCLVR